MFDGRLRPASISNVSLHGVSVLLTSAAQELHVGIIDGRLRNSFGSMRVVGSREALQTVVNVKRMYFTKVTQWLRITQ